MNLDNIKHILNPIFRDYEYIAAAYLFGSLAQGKAGVLSDIDIAILLKDNAPSEVKLLDEENFLEYKISSSLGFKKVDLIILNHQGLIFQHNVLRTGKLIYEKDSEFRKRFEMRVIINFCDFKPTLDFIEKYHIKGRLRRCETIWNKVKFRQN